MRTGILLFFLLFLADPALAQAPATLEPPADDNAPPMEPAPAPGAPAAGENPFPEIAPPGVPEPVPVPQPEVQPQPEPPPPPPDFPVPTAAPYERPDLSVPLVIAADCGMNETEVSGLMQDLGLLVRNFPDDPRITQKLRARAISFALSLQPGHRDMVVANGQLARGITPRLLPVDGPLTTGMLAARLHARAVQLLQKGSTGAARSGRLTLALAAALNWDYAPELAAEVPPEEDLWLERLPAVVVPAGPTHTVQLEQASVRVMIPSLGFLGIQLIPSRLTARKDVKEFRVALATGVPDNDARWEYARTWLARRYPEWPGGCIATVQYPGALPPAVGGLIRAVLADRYLAGAVTHPETVLACGLSEDGAIVSTTDPVVALNAAISHQGTPVRLVLAAEDEEVLLNWIIADRRRWEKFCRVTVLTAATLQDVIGLTERKHAALLDRALQKFDSLKLNPPSAQRMKSPEVLKGLEEAATLHPRHFSASILNRIARGNLPKQFTMARSLALLEPLHQRALNADATRPESNLTVTVFGSILDELAKNRPMLQPGLLEWAREITEMARLRDRYLLRPPTDTPSREQMRSTLAKQRERTGKSRLSAYQHAGIPVPGGVR